MQGRLQVGIGEAQLLRSCEIGHCPQGQVVTESGESGHSEGTEEVG